MKLRLLITVLLAALLTACDRPAAAGSNSAASASGTHGAVTPDASSLRAYLPKEDGWQNDPANQPHAGDPNPLRRALGDGPIIHGLLGRPSNSLFVSCAKNHAAAGCAALQQTLLQRAHAAGFTDATADDVLDPRMVR